MSQARPRGPQKIASTAEKPPHGAGGLPTDRQFRALIYEALPEDLDVTPMAGFKLNLSANPGFKKAFFSIRCECGTAAVLSIEVSAQKTTAEIEDALPSLVDRLKSQAKSFRAMPCDAHLRMRLGGVSREPS